MDGALGKGTDPARSYSGPARLDKLMSRRANVAKTKSQLASCDWQVYGPDGTVMIGAEPVSTLVVTVPVPLIRFFNV